MAFIPKIWQGREVEHPGRIVLTPTGNPNEYDVSRSEGQVTREGDFLGTVNLNDLEQRILNGTAAGDGSGNALNALSLGGVAAANYPQISSGTWTPVISGNTVAGSPTYETRTGTWYKIGRLVMAYFTIILSDIGGMEGALLMTGLPFAVNTAVAEHMGIYSGFNLASGKGFDGYHVFPSSVSFVSRRGNSSTNIFATDITNTLSIRASSVVYLTN